MCMHWQTDSHAPKVKPVGYIRLLHLCCAAPHAVDGRKADNKGDNSKDAFKPSQNEQHGVHGDLGIFLWLQGQLQ